MRTRQVGDNPEDWTVGADRDLPIDSSTTWDGQAARDSIFAWAEDADGNIDASKAKRGFLIYDAGNSELRGAYKLPFAHYIGGLKASPAGIRAASSRLPQADAPQAVLDRAQAVLDHYYDRMEEESSAAASAQPSRRQLGAMPQRGFRKEAFIETVMDDRTAHFIASTNSVDRYGDVIEQTWELGDFWRNPVFLWCHQSWDPPIGWVRSFEVNQAKTATTARVEFYPEGTDEFADKLFRLTRIGGIKAVSVGFLPLEIEDRLDDDKHWLGYHFMRSKLVELSLCTVPANPDALALAKSIDPNPRFLRRVFSDFPVAGDPAARDPRLSRRPSATAPEFVGKSRLNSAMRELARFQGQPAP